MCIAVQGRDLRIGRKRADATYLPKSFERRLDINYEEREKREAYTTAGTVGNPEATIYMDRSFTR